MATTVHLQDIIPDIYAVTIFVIKSDFNINLHRSRHVVLYSPKEYVNKRCVFCKNLLSQNFRHLTLSDLIR